MPKVLVVDGERAQFDRLQVACEIAGMSVAWSANVAEALRAVRQEPPVAILLDGGLPGTSIGDVVTLLKENPSTSRIPIILVCERNSDSLAKGWNTDADMVLEKPVDPVELVAVVDRMAAASQ